MARLFLTTRETNFISDITKEVIKDVIGSRIFYYPICEAKTKVDGLYGESLEKVFDGPFIIDALVDNVYQSDTKIDSAGIDSKYKIEAFIQYRDLADKKITINIGDFFSYGEIFYEITERLVLNNIYGMTEHKAGVKIVGTKAREGQFRAPILGPTDITKTDADAVQKTFVQQRGAAQNSEGETGDVRELIKNGVIEPISGPKQVSEQGALADNSHYGSSFYGDE
jgi:hypothetical protein